MARESFHESDLWRIGAAAAVAFGVWRLADLAAGWLVARIIDRYPGLASSGGLRWLLVSVLGLFAVGFVVVLAELAGRRVALLVGSVLLGINAFQAVAALAWRLGTEFSPGGDLAGLTQYAGEAAALAVALAILLLVRSPIGGRDRE